MNKLSKILFAILLVGLVLFSGCSNKTDAQTTDNGVKETNNNNVVEENANEDFNQIVNDEFINDDVEIGELI